MTGCTCTGLGLRVMVARLTGRPVEHAPDCSARLARYTEMLALRTPPAGTRPLVFPVATPTRVLPPVTVPLDRWVRLAPYARGGAQ